MTVCIIYSTVARVICVRLTVRVGDKSCAVSSIVGVGGVGSFESSVAFCGASGFDMVLQPFHSPRTSADDSRM